MNDRRKTTATRLCSLVALAIVAAVCTAQNAVANSKQEPPEPAVTSTSKAGAAARAKAGAKATSASHSGVGDVSQGLSTGDDRSRFLSLALAPLAFTPPMAPIEGCSVRVTQSARGFGLGVLSTADSLADPTDCTLIALRNAKVEACQYGSAKQIEDLLVAKLLPGFAPSAAGDFVDLSRQACAALKAPPIAAAEPQNLIAVPPAASEAAASMPAACAAAAPPKPSASGAKRGKRCVGACCEKR